jgi:PucR C-terminal helix-turn-helix domain
MDITLEDLMLLEPRLMPRFGDAAVDARRHNPASIEVSWAVSARATAPLLPSLRGGEMLFISPRVAAEIGSDLIALINEGSARGVSAIVFASGDPTLQSLDPDTTEANILQWDGELNNEAELSINRALTECRGNMFHVGTELERKLSELSVKGVGVNALVSIVSTIAGIAVAVHDSQGRSIVTSDLADDCLTSAVRGGTRCVTRELALGARLMLGPHTAGEFVLARFLIDRIANAAELALQRDEILRPRGAQRLDATRALLVSPVSSPNEYRAAALALGLDPDGAFIVVVTHGYDETTLKRLFAPLGTVQPAGNEHEAIISLISLAAGGGTDGIRGRVQQLKRIWLRDRPDDGAWIALSAPTIGVEGLPVAYDEARFIAALQLTGRLKRHAASFDSVDDLGAMRMLYQLRDSPELRQFVADALGALMGRETLRTTLRVFLDSGGSQVEASRRLGIHRNTLAYRLRRVGSLIGVDATDPGEWLTLHLAVCAEDLLKLTHSQS